MEKKYNTRSPAVKRLMREAAELAGATSEYSAAPLEDNLFEWHFTVRGPGETEFEGGIYHGRIIVPPEYPMKPPDIILLTPNGRFEVGKKICLSISGHHPETWQPSWSIRTALLAIIAFMPTPAQGTIGSLDYSTEERRALARRSQDWVCPLCGPISQLVLPAGMERSQEVKREMENLVQAVTMKGEEEKKKTEEKVNTAAEVNEETAEAGRPTPARTETIPDVTISEEVEERSGSSAAEPSENPAAEQRPARLPVQQRQSREELQESRGRGYDIIILVLVAAIAVLLARRIGLMQDAGSLPPSQ